jgi:hypothetical protein
MNPKVKLIAKNNSVDGQTFESCNSRAGFEPLTFGYQAQKDNAIAAAPTRLENNSKIHLRRDANGRHKKSGWRG